MAAVHDGYVLNKSIVRTPVAGHLLNLCLQQSLESKGTTIRPRYEFRRVETAPGNFTVEYTEKQNTTASFRAYQVENICQDIKHSLCRVSETPFNPEENASIPTVSYELPDGQEIQVGAPRFSIPELLFNPSLLQSFGDVGATVKPIGSSTNIVGLSAAIAECIGRCDIDVRRELWPGIVLTGGTSLFSSLRDRLEKELAEIAPPMVKVKVNAASNMIERRYSTWIGGSILASLGTFQQMWMSKAEYKEHGAGLIHKRAP